MSYVSTPPTTPSTDVVRAFQKMRRGVLYVLIAWVFLGVGFTIMVGGLFVTVMRAAVGGGALIAALSGLILGLALIVIGAIIALVGFYADFIPGADDLARVNPDFSTASSLIRIGYIWGLILCLVGAILTIVIILLIGYVFLLIGFIGIMIMCFKLNEIYGNVMYLIAGIFFILSIFIPFLGIVSWVLLYVALGETIRKSQTSAGPTQPLIQV
jgi:hypothetical protein